MLVTAWFAKGTIVYDFRSLRYLEGLDGLRLLAVGLVLLGHFGVPRMPAGFGVTIFFFVSGFLITTLLVHEMVRNQKIGVREFYIRRFLRLAPELLGLITGSTLIGLFLNQKPNVLETLAAIFYFTNYYIAWLYSTIGVEAIPYWTHLWSLSVEEHYYITFPIIFSVIYKHSRARTAFFLTVLIGCLIWRCFVVLADLFPISWTNPYTYMASEARMDSIAYGALFAFAAQKSWRASRMTSIAALCCGILLILFTLLVRNDVFRETVRYSLQGVGLFLVFTHLYLSSSRSFMMPILETRIARAGGVLSYGTYLWHGEVIRLFETIGLDTREGTAATKLVGIPLGIAASFAVAWVSYKVLATPAAGLRRKFGSHVVS